MVFVVPVARARGHHSHGLDDRRGLLPVLVVFVESAADRIAEKPRAGDGRGRGRVDGGRRRLVSVRRGRRPVQEIDVLVELRVIRYRGGGGGGGRDDGGPFGAAYERIDQERPGHGLLGGTGHGHRGDGRRARCAVHRGGQLIRISNKAVQTERPRTLRGTLFVPVRARGHDGDQR